MLKANEVRIITDSHNKDKIDAEFLEITNKIIEASESGKYSVEYCIKFDININKLLLSDFKINKIGYMTYSISWCHDVEL